LKRAPTQPQKVEGQERDVFDSDTAAHHTLERLEALLTVSKRDDLTVEDGRLRPAR
jgi:hypothetical protein